MGLQDYLEEQQKSAAPLGQFLPNGAAEVDFTLPEEQFFSSRFVKGDVKSSTVVLYGACCRAVASI